MGLRRVATHSLGGRRGKRHRTRSRRRNRTLRGRMRGGLQRRFLPAVDRGERHSFWFVVPAADDADQKHLVRRDEFQLEIFADDQDATTARDLRPQMDSAFRVWPVGSCSRGNRETPGGGSAVPRAESKKLGKKRIVL